MFRIDETHYSIGNGTTRNEQAIVVINGDQSPIKHPMHGARKRNSVSNTVRSTVSHGPNVGGLNLGTTTSVDQLDTSYGACVVIRGLNCCGKSSVSKRSLN